MKLILFYDRLIKKLQSEYRKKVFCEYISCKHKNIKIVGPITVKNKNIIIGNNCCIYPNVMIFGDGLIKIGNNVDIGNGTIIYASRDGGIEIGDNTTIAAQSYIIDMDHGIKKDDIIKNQKNIVEKIFIGENVWIGANVTILKGSVIESGCIIGAKALVKSYIKSNHIAIGIPAKIMRERE